MYRIRSHAIIDVAQHARPRTTLHTQGSWLHHLFAGFGWPQGAVLLAALIAAAGVTATILTTSSRARRDRLASLYADALSAVSEYIEGPYRIRRRTQGEASQRFTITALLSDVKARIDHSENMLALHAHQKVANAFHEYVNAAQREAGTQMHDAWTRPGISDDDEVNLSRPYPRERSDPLRGHAVAVMQADLALRAVKPWTWTRYWRTVREAELAAQKEPVARTDSDETKDQSAASG